jgi:hypothetical protein
MPRRLWVRAARSRVGSMGGVPGGSFDAAGPVVRVTGASTDCRRADFAGTRVVVRPGRGPAPTPDRRRGTRHTRSPAPRRVRPRPGPYRPRPGGVLRGRGRPRRSGGPTPTARSGRGLTRRRGLGAAPGARRAGRCPRRSALRAPRAGHADHDPATRRAGPHRRRPGGPGPWESPAQSGRPRRRRCCASTRVTQLRPRRPRRMERPRHGPRRPTPPRRRRACASTRPPSSSPPTTPNPWSQPRCGLPRPQGDTAGAAEAFQRRRHPRGRPRPAHHADLGAAALAAGDVARAMASYERAAALRPGPTGSLLANLGYALHLARRSDEAVTTLQRAVERSPRTVTAWNNLAAVLARPRRPCRRPSRRSTERSPLSPERPPRLRAQWEALTVRGAAR